MRTIKVEAQIYSPVTTYHMAGIVGGASRYWKQYSPPDTDFPRSLKEAISERLVTLFDLLLRNERNAKIYAVCEDYGGSDTYRRLIPSHEAQIFSVYQVKMIEREIENLMAENVKPYGPGDNYHNKREYYVKDGTFFRRVLGTIPTRAGKQTLVSPVQVY